MADQSPVLPGYVSLDDVLPASLGISPTELEDSIKRTCPTCRGSGIDPATHEQGMPGQDPRGFRPCPACGGKGERPDG